MKVLGVNWFNWQVTHTKWIPISALINVNMIIAEGYEIGKIKKVK